MNRAQKLQKVVSLLDILANLDKWFWIDTKNLRQLYLILTSIDDEETFDNTFNAIVTNIDNIFEKLNKLGKKIDTINIQRDEKIDNRVDKLNLSALEKKFNF